MRTPSLDSPTDIVSKAKSFSLYWVFVFIVTVVFNYWAGRFQPVLPLCHLLLPSWCHHQPVGLAKPSGSHNWSVFCMHVATLSSSSFMTLHCITSAEETMFFASQQHELKNQSTTLALPARLSCTISRRLSISVSKALLSKSSVLQINWVKNWYNVFRLKSVSIKSKFRWQSS